jgi:rubrerythrin
VNALNENTNQAPEASPVPETSKIGNPPLEDKQLEDVAGGTPWAYSPSRCVECGEPIARGSDMRCPHCGKKRF